MFFLGRKKIVRLLNSRVKRNLFRLFCNAQDNLGDNFYFVFHMVNNISIQFKQKAYFRILKEKTFFSLLRLILLRDTFYIYLHDSAQWQLLIILYLVMK